MKKKSKLTTIARSFTEKESSLSDAVLEFRRSACAGCPHNSANAKSEDMSVVDKVRKKLNNSNPHCILCSCIIENKTSQPNEECALTMLGENPKWSREKIELVSSNSFDMVNDSTETMSIDLNPNGESYDVKFHSIKNKKGKSHKFEGAFSLQYPDKGKVEIVSVVPTCSCTVPDFKATERSLLVDFTMEIKKVSALKTSTIKKYLYVHYRLDGQLLKLKINLLGEVQWV